MWKNLPLFPEQASTLAREVDNLYYFLIAVSIFFGGLITALLVGLSLRYRRRSGADKATPIEGSVKLEILWTVIPLMLTMVMFGWGAKVYARTYLMPSDALDFYITGKQWMWKIQHPTGQREINDMHVPVGTPIKLTMASEDVIHSFFIPAFRMKRDVLPGRYTTAWFEATEIGEYHIFCTEYCGTKHSDMIGTITVMSPDDYRQWLEGAPIEAAPEIAGAAIFQAQRCGSCHGETNESRGPSLRGIFGETIPLDGGGEVIADEEYLRESILEPRAKIHAGYRALMPTYAGQLTDDEVRALVAYLKTNTAETEQ